MRRAHRIPTEAIEWIAPGIPAGMFCAVSGRPDGGKSTWTAWLAAQVSLWAPVIYSNHEDHAAAQIKPRLRAAGADLRRVFVPEEPFLLPEDCDDLERRIRQTGTKLVVMDSAAQHFTVKSTSGPQIRKALTPLRGLLERTECGCIFVDHLIKRPSRTAHPLEALAGAGSGLPAACRFVYVWGINPHDDTERILAEVKGNPSKDKLQMAFTITSADVYDDDDYQLLDEDGVPLTVGVCELVNEESTVDASEVIAFNGGGNASGLNDGVGGVKGAIAQEWLIGELMFGTRKAKDLEGAGNKAQFSFRTLQRAADAIGVSKKRIGAGPGSYLEWSLPPTHPALETAKRMGGSMAAATGAKKKKKKP